MCRSTRVGACPASAATISLREFALLRSSGGTLHRRRRVLLGQLHRRHRPVTAVLRWRCQNGMCANGCSCSYLGC